MEDNLLNAYGPCGKLIELDYGSQTIESIKEEPNETWEAWEKKPKLILRINWK